MNTQKRKTIFANVLLLLLAFSIVFYPSNLPRPKGWEIVLEVEKYGESGLEYHYVKRGDLILRNFAYFIGMMFRGTTDFGEDPDKDHNMTDQLGNYNESYSYIDTVPGDLYQYPYTTIGGAGGLSEIIIGTGATSPALTDFNAVATYNGRTVDKLFYTTSGTAINLTLCTVFSFSGSASISEAVLLMHSDQALVGATNKYAICRDTFTAIPCVSGNTLLVKYILIFNG